MPTEGQIKIKHDAFDTAIQTLNANAETLEKAIAELKGKTDTLSQEWKGESGDAFSTLFQEMQETLNTQVTNLRTIGENLHTTDEAFQDLDCQVRDEITKGE